MADLDGPYEILELGDGGSLVLHPLAWTEGDMTINPRYRRTPKVITAIRVWVPTSDKPLFPDYYDITSATLVAQIRPVLERPDFRELAITITKHGVAPKARYSMNVTRPG